jgi:hypothetical protein
MSVFKSEKFVSGTGVDLDLVATELAEHFRERKYDVMYSQVDEKTWDVSITRGGMFKQAVGLKSALKIEMERRPQGTYIRAGAGVFGKQAAPTAITMFVAWPVLLVQVWGLIREAGLDDEAVRVVELSITRRLRSVDRHAADPEAGAAARTQNGTAPAPPRFCANCGVERAPQASFCPACGTPGL